MPSLKDLMTPYRMNNHNPLPIYSVDGNNLDLIEAELLAPLQAENARLRARLWGQVKAGERMRSALRVTQASENTEEISCMIDDGVKAWDAATAPADAEEPKGIPLTIKEIEVAIGRLVLDLNVTNTRLDDHDRRLELKGESLNVCDRRLDGTDKRLDEHDESLTFISGWGKDMQKRIDEMNDRMDEENEAGSMRLLAIEKRLDDLAARVDGVDRRFGISEKTVVERLDRLAARVKEHHDWLGKAYEELGIVDGRPLSQEVAGLSEAVELLENRIANLEAARQPQPTPSAPVTDAIEDAAFDAYAESHRTNGLIRTAIRAAVTAAFAARDAGEAGR